MILGCRILFVEGLRKPTTSFSLLFCLVTNSIPQNEPKSPSECSLLVRTTPCDPWSRGVLQRRHIVAGSLNYCGKEFKRKLEQGPIDHELDYQCEEYENGRVAADPETLRELAGFSEGEIANETGLHSRPIRLLRHGGTVARRTYQRMVAAEAKISPLEPGSER